MCPCNRLHVYLFQSRFICSCISFNSIRWNWEQGQTLSVNVSQCCYIPILTNQINSYIHLLLYFIISPFYLANQPEQTCCSAIKYITINFDLMNFGLGKGSKNWHFLGLRPKPETAPPPHCALEEGLRRTISYLHWILLLFCFIDELRWEYSILKKFQSISCFIFD